ncbi:MAG: hypothetical protein U9N80_00190 [Chloroflexota bacterium]|nr:hypothetical protein [Chloroflexota bacterium]
MDIPLPVGYPDSHQGPLKRFMPPLEEGVIGQVLADDRLPAGLILDPFGASPRLVLEAAQSGRAVLVAANNPVTRFVLQHTLQPFELGELQAALSHLAAIPKDDTRMEHFILDLYRSTCTRCGEAISVEFFVWDPELGGPTHKVYSCDHCAHAGESPTTEDDWNRALDFSRRGLQHALALEQVAPTGDPDRQHAEAALSVYPGRAIYALITITNKIDQLALDGSFLRALHALLLSAFDGANALWSYPEGRERPRQLSASQRYREQNVWRALEQAVETWAMEQPDLQVIDWPSDSPMQAGTIAIYPGTVRDLMETLDPAQVSLLLTVPPRHNQAFWTLSALWAAWLWGRETAAPIKGALRRRRYDWSWHAAALGTVLTGMAASIKKDTPVISYLPEAEPGFIAAVLSGFNAAGFALCGRALRAGEEQAVFHWKVASVASMACGKKRREERMRSSGRQILTSRAEPSAFPLLHSAAWSDLVVEGLLASIREVEGRQFMQVMGESLETVLGDRKTFLHMGRGAEVESGLYWLYDPPFAEASLTDLVERQVLESLRKEGWIFAYELDKQICKQFPGLLTPDRRLIDACLRSYAEGPDTDGRWRLRAEDDAASRQEDCAEIRRMLVNLGSQLEFEVSEGEMIKWLGEDGEVAYAFRIMETAVWAGVHQSDAVEAITYVIPGGRAELVAEKARRDPRLLDWLQDGPPVIKFRLVRRLIAETTLTRENLPERLSIDPPEHQDPQLPLL